jgi:hypothetical protein
MPQWRFGCSPPASQVAQGRCGDGRGHGQRAQVSAKVRLGASPSALPGRGNDDRDRRQLRRQQRSGAPGGRRGLLRPGTDPARSKTKDRAVCRLRPPDQSHVDPMHRLCRRSQTDSSAARHAPLLRLRPMETRLSLLPRRTQPRPPLPPLAVQNLRQPSQTPAPPAPRAGFRIPRERRPRSRLSVSNRHEPHTYAAESPARHCPNKHALPSLAAPDSRPRRTVYRRRASPGFQERLAGDPLLSLARRR